jgi:cytochrome bd ubiquinol oxidase subunit I
VDDVVLLSRLQFALTVAFHFLFPPLSIGLGLILVVMEGLYLRTGNVLYHGMTRFWVKVFGLIFAIGVASGIVLEFQFGTNWSTYSRFVGDVFGSALAAEGIFAFFLESGFLAILLFGWNRVSARMHFFATVMVALGAHFSAVWILIANSWQQTPAGHRIVDHVGGPRAEIADFWAVVFNPSSMQRLSHTLSACWQSGAFLVVSVSAYYLLKNRHTAFAKASMKIGLAVAIVASLLQLVTGHWSATVVAEHQPAKLAAFEGHFDASAPAALYVFGWVDADGQRVVPNLGIPGGLSFLLYGDRTVPVTGLNAFPPEDRPPINPVFQSYHLMVAIGLSLIGLSLIAGLYWWRGKLFETRWLLKLMVLSVLGPQLANQAGWFSAEVGRQPWVVYHLLRTRDAFSPNVDAGQVAASLAMFVVVYGLLFALFVFLLDQKIRGGPDAPTPAPGGGRA